MQYLAWPGWFCTEPARARIWHKRAWGRLAWIARYGRVPPGESAHWEMADLYSFADALDEIVRAENKTSK